MSVQQAKKFDLIRGGRSDGFLLGPLRIWPAPLDAPPFPVQVRVREEDTWLISTPTSVLPDTWQHPIRVMTDVIDQKAARPGSVLVRDDLWLAIVYDLDQATLCRETWLREALGTIVQRAEQNRITSLCLPLPGCQHRSLGWRTGLDLLLDVLGQSPLRSLSRIWLVVAEDLLIGINQRLRQVAIQSDR